MLGKNGLHLWLEINGVPCSEVASNFSLPKSLSNTATFPDFSNDRKYIYNFSLRLLIKLLSRLRKYDLQTANFEFFLTAKNFQTKAVRETLEEPSSQDSTLIFLLKSSFSAIFQEGEIYRKSGIFFTKLVSGGKTQMSLFSPENKEKNLGKTIDKWNISHRDNKIFPGTLLCFKSRKSQKGIDKPVG